MQKAKEAFEQSWISNWNQHSSYDTTAPLVSGVNENLVQTVQLTGQLNTALSESVKQIQEMSKQQQLAIDGMQKTFDGVKANIDFKFGKMN